MNESDRFVIGYLKEYARAGPLIDVFIDNKGKISSPQREKWAYQIMRCISDIIMEGLLAAQNRLSKSVIDEHDTVKIASLGKLSGPGSLGCTRAWAVQ